MARNGARSTIVVPPAPALSGLSCTVLPGQGGRFVAGQATISPPYVTPDPDNWEIVTVDDVAGDVVTLSARATEGTPAREIGAGWQIQQGLTEAELATYLRKGTTTLPTSLTQLLRVEIPDDGSPSAEWPDRIVCFYIDPDDGEIRTGYLNEFGEIRGGAAKASTVAARFKAHPNNTTVAILQVTDHLQANVYLAVSKLAVACLVPISAPNVPIDKVRASDATPVTNSETLVTDDVMQAALTAGTWIVEGTVFYDCAAAADARLRFNFTGTGTAAIAGNVLTTAATSSATNSSNHAVRSLNTNFVAGGFGVGSVGACLFRGVVTVTASGTLAVQYAQNVADASDLTIRAGSHLSFRRAA